MPRREHARRNRGSAPAKRTYTLAEMQAMVSGGGRACIAVITESEEQPGTVYFAAMLCAPGTCPKRCDDARGRLRPWPTPPAPVTATTTYDEENSPTR